jgi:capsular exopolysaccharide synthesis family protein
VALGAIAGLLLAAAYCLLKHVSGGRISSPEDLIGLTGAAAIGSMPLASGGLRLLPGGRSVPVRILDIGDSGVVETLRALRLSVQAAWGAPCTCLLVSSALPGEGKTTLAVSLALTSAADGLRVLLIEADLRRPAIARVMRAKAAHSIQEFLAGDLTLPQAVHVEGRTGLHCLLSDGASSNAHVLLQSTGFTRLIANARVAYDLVIIDSPPVMHVADPLILATHTDCVLFAVDWQRASRQVVAEALRRFPQRIRENVATVLTRVPRSRLQHRGYYAGYKMPARA